MIGVPMIAAGSFHNISKRADGSIWAWGSNDFGELGDGTNENRLKPIRVGTANDWATVSSSAGGGHTIATKEDGSIWGWGRNQFGELRAYPFQNKNTPTLIGNDANVLNVAALPRATFELRTDGTLWAWGDGLCLGAGLHDPTPYAVPVGGTASNDWAPANDWASVPAGDGWLSALKKDGSLWIWGDYFPTPVRVGTTTDWRTAGEVFALKNNGTLWSLRVYCSSSRSGTPVSCSPPDQVGTDEDWDKLGGRLALKKSGTLWDLSGTAPSQVGLDTDWDQIASGNCHFLATKRDGSVWAWGCNDSGQLGQGDTQPRATPTMVVF